MRILNFNYRNNRGITRRKGKLYGCHSLAGYVHSPGLLSSPSLYAVLRLAATLTWIPHRRIHGTSYHGLISPWISFIFAARFWIILFTPSSRPHLTHTRLRLRDSIYVHICMNVCMYMLVHMWGTDDTSFIEYYNICKTFMLIWYDKSS